MRIPEHYKRPGWQRFFAGFFLGTLVGWTFFVYHFGNVHEDLIIEIKKHELTIQNQKDTIETLRSEERRLNEENQKKLTIQDIKIYFTNEQRLKLSELTTYELKQLALNELKFLEGQEIGTVASTKELMLRTIENKVFQINENRYQLKAEEVYLYTTLELYLSIKIGD